MKYFSRDCIKIQNKQMLTFLMNMLSMIGDYIESWQRCFIVAITNYLPVKVIRDDKGVPFLYRYHLFTLGNDGPGMCIHRFVKSDPDRGYHDHPWSHAVSFILCGGYSERILINPPKDTLEVEIKDTSKDTLDVEKEEKKEEVKSTKYIEKWRGRWTFNYLNGKKTFHRVMIEEGKDAWTLFAFQKRSKTWGMIGLDRIYKAMSSMVSDNDGGWWNTVKRGLGLHSRLPLAAQVVSSVDIIVLKDDSSEVSNFSNKTKVLLIKRGKAPYKDSWAFPGGRIEPTDKDLLSAAQRELREETSITGLDLEFVTTVGNRDRDPRGFSITNVFSARVNPNDNIVVKAGDDAVDYDWFYIDELPPMAFDHEEILKMCISLY